MIMSPIELGKNNMFRRAAQVLDLMSLHNQIHCYKRPALALSTLILVLMQELGILDLSTEQDAFLL